MTTNNAWNSENPAQVARGGTGAATLGDGFVLLGSGTNAITALDVTAKGSVLAGDGTTDPVALAVGSNDQVLTADSGEASGLKWAAAAGGGTQTQQVRTSTSAFFNVGTAIPWDDTIPQNDEGDEILTLAITPTATDSILFVEASITGRVDTTNRHCTAAIFRDATAGAIGAALIGATDSTDGITDAFGSIRVWATSGSTDATTFKLRCGSDQTSGLSINGSSATRRYGGVSSTTLTITEYSA